MKSAFGFMRLVIGCWVLLFGVMFLISGSGDLVSGYRFPRWWGVVIGGIGLAVTLRESITMLALSLKEKGDERGW